MLKYTTEQVRELYPVGVVYVCDNCGEVFDEPAEWIERHSVGGPYDPDYLEPMTGCPACGCGYSEWDGGE